MIGWKKLSAWPDRFLFESCHPQTCAMLRVGYGVLLLIYVAVWWVDAEMWFSDLGLMSLESAKLSVAPTHWSLFFWIPSSPWIVHSCLAILFLNGILLTLGCFSRLQAALIFFWLVSFQNRSPLIGDGEDTVFRVFAFFLIFMPLDAHWSILPTRARDEKDAAGPAEAAWGIRLVQLQMAVIYLSAAWCKILGASWQQGTALYYVYQMGDTFGRGPLPAFLMETEWLIRATTWSVLALEALLPILLFVPRTRLAGICLGLLLHASMEYAMHLFLFQWIMMFGVLSFTKPSDISFCRNILRRSERNSAALSA